MSRRGRRHDEAAHGGAWKIALADLMTVLMVFFLVMWLMAAVDPKDRDAFVQGISGEAIDSGDIPMLDSVPLQAEVIQLELKPPASKEEIEAAMKDISPKDINIEDTPEYTRITLKSDSFFESARATINDNTRAQLEKLGETLAGRGQYMTITGYTDNLPINNFQFPSNWELSAARAATVTRTFIDMEVDPRLITIEGKADNNAVAPNKTGYGRSLNRRVVITIDKVTPVSFE
ncbi:Flagellar motor rotation protein MotB [hydrothermal vent metagenome]|uniref:Flagellar motor rotation protein MotB n=1 Tax=hydrothermal vent metagenome TaxID=652676 RepID=A0A3B0VRS2_9ZZZZ